MMPSDIPAALLSQVASNVRWLSVLDACPAFAQIHEKVMGDRRPASHDVTVVAFFLQVFGEP
jgi:hypothetical protein